MEAKASAQQLRDELLLKTSEKTSEMNRQLNPMVPPPPPVPFLIGLLARPTLVCMHPERESILRNSPQERMHPERECIPRGRSQGL